MNVDGHAVTKLEKSFMINGRTPLEEEPMIERSQKHLHLHSAICPFGHLLFFKMFVSHLSGDHKEGPLFKFSQHLIA